MSRGLALVLELVRRPPALQVLVLERANKLIERATSKDLGDLGSVSCLAIRSPARAASSYTVRAQAAGRRKHEVAETVSDLRGLCGGGWL
jgi:hypothetical protein